MKKFFTVEFYVGIAAGVLLGTLLGALSMGFVVQFIIKKAISNEQANGVFTGYAVEQVREGFGIVAAEKQTKKVYGYVVSIGGGKLVLKVERNQGPQEYTFYYDNETKIVSLAQDANSNEIPLSSDAIEAGAGLNVFTDEPVGSVEHQRAIKIIQI